MGHRGHLRPWVGTGCMAEQVTSLGKDWHQPCRKCEKCGKTLMSGAMLSMGKPYCNHPCYAAVFGPTCVGVLGRSPLAPRGNLSPADTLILAG
uniref:LIM zinc-binding domain-containing protein n=1 Tax=Ursus maritimus TaxID=29073 RepID=A0A452T3K5_URSMA